MTDPYSPLDCPHPHIEETYLGEDPQRGRYADVTLKRCASCNAHWVHYYFGYEAFSGSGRWYEGEITEEHAQKVTAANAAELLEALERYEAGGTYFGGTVQVRSGPLLDGP